MYFTMNLLLQGVESNDFANAFSSCSRALSRTIAEILPGVSDGDIGYLRIVGSYWYSVGDGTAISFNVRVPSVLNQGYSDASNALAVATSLLDSAATTGSFTIRLRHFAKKEEGSRIALNAVVVNASSVTVGNSWVNTVAASTGDDDLSPSSKTSLNTNALILGVVLGSLLLLVLVCAACYFYSQWQKALSPSTIQSAETSREDGAVADSPVDNQTLVIVVDSDHLSSEIDVEPVRAHGNVVAVIGSSPLSLV